MADGSGDAEGMELGVVGEVLVETKQADVSKILFDGFRLFILVDLF